MRFATRSFTGLLLGLLALALLGLAAASVQSALRERAGASRPAPAGQERVYSVSVARLEAGTVAPVVTAYGEVASARTLEIRPSVGGTLVELAAGFREGGAVAAGETLYAVDPADAEAALATTEVDLEEAEAERAEAEAAVGLARADREAAERQLDLRAAAVARQRSLGGRGVGTATELDAAEIALVQAEQALVGRAQAEAQAEARIERAGIALRRAEIARSEAARRLSATRAVAPFDGVLAGVAARPGALVGATELLATLVDPGALEVAFRVTSDELARLHGERGLMPLAVTVHLGIEGRPAAVPGRLERAGVALAGGEAGRVLYAALESAAAGLVRPGDFVRVEVEEPALDGVAVIPAAALGPDGRILVLGEGERLREAAVRVVRRQGDGVIVADAPWGAEYVTARAGTLAPGVRVRPVPAEEAVVLAPEERAALIAAVEANDLIPAAVRAELLEGLGAERVPRSVLDRIDTATGG
jgi:multidrug efflux pump subunit AcrA (membrane-fusion protein)